jgi:WD40 repeat protein
MSAAKSGTAARAVLVAGAVGGIEDFPVALAWTPDGSALLVGGGEGGIHRVQARDGAMQKLGEHAPGLLQLAVQPGGALLATTGQDGSVRLWNFAGDALVPKILHRARSWPAGLAWRADGQAMAFTSGKDVLVFDADGQLLREMGGHSCPLTHLIWRGRNEVIAAGNGALFADRVDNGEVAQFVLEGTPLTLALSPDLKVAASGLADGTINFRYINNRKRSRMSGYEGKVDQTAWSSSSRYLATASAGASSIVVWDFGGKGPEGSEPLQLNAHEERIESLAWQGTGSLLASAGRDWRVVLWRPAPNSRTALDIQLLDGPAVSACWSPDSTRLAVVQASGKIRFFLLAAG